MSHMRRVVHSRPTTIPQNLPSILGNKRFLKVQIKQLIYIWLHFQSEALKGMGLKHIHEYAVSIGSDILVKHDFS